MSSSRESSDSDAAVEFRSNPMHTRGGVAKVKVEKVGVEKEKSKEKETLNRLHRNSSEPPPLPEEMKSSMVSCEHCEVTLVVCVCSHRSLTLSLSHSLTLSLSHSLTLSLSHSLTLSLTLSHPYISHPIPQHPPSPPPKQAADSGKQASQVVRGKSKVSFSDVAKANTVEDGSNGKAKVLGKGKGKHRGNQRKGKTSAGKSTSLSSPKKEKRSFEQKMLDKIKFRSARMQAPELEGGVQPSQRADATEIVVAVVSWVGFFYCLGLAGLHYTPESVA